MPTGYEYSNENNRNAQAVIGTTPIKIMERLPVGTRILFSLGNESATGQVITLSFGGSSVANSGLPMRVGGKWVEAKSEGFEPTSQEVWAVSSGAGAVLTIMERQRAVL